MYEYIREVTIRHPLFQAQELLDKPDPGSQYLLPPISRLKGLATRSIESLLKDSPQWHCLGSFYSRTQTAAESMNTPAKKMNRVSPQVTFLLLPARAETKTRNDRRTEYAPPCLVCRAFWSAQWSRVVIGSIRKLGSRGEQTNDEVRAGRSDLGKQVGPHALAQIGFKCRIYATTQKPPSRGRLAAS